MWKKPIFKKLERGMNNLPGMTIIIVIILARGLGLLQGWEWTSFDGLLHLRPLEARDERIVIIGINESDIREIKQYPLSDAEIASLIQNLQQYNPRAIGLDIVRDLPVEPGHEQIVKILQNTSNLFGIQQVLGLGIAPPTALPATQIGFSDALPDADGRMRRSLLGTYVKNNPDYQFSLALRLAEAYLIREGFTLENGQKDPKTMRFGTVELPRFFAHTGSYVNAEAGGVQILLNYRNNHQGFPTFSLKDIKSGNINAQSLKDRLILIGMTTPSVPDLVYTTTVFSSQVKGEIYGVEFQAHAISQILSAVLDRRPLLRSLAEGWEYLWIIAWGLGGIYLSHLTVSPIKNLLAVVISCLILIVIGYLFLLGGWWLPIIPALLALGLNGIILSSFYLSYRSLLLQLAGRQQTIEETLTIIHNGPLQTLATALKKARNKENEEIIRDLEYLNQEIRGIGEYLRQDSLHPSESLRLGSGLILDLRHPLHELFYQVYSSTLNRKLPCFTTLKVKIRAFDPISTPLTLEIKQELCQFLEEALCNIGKHAQGVIRIDAIGTEKEGWYILSIQDNGTGKNVISECLGTQQAQKLAKRLKGIFRRERLQPRGILCELSWPLLPQKQFKLASLMAFIQHKLYFKK